MTRQSHPTKEAREMHKILTARGWVLEDGTGRHLAYRYPNGALLTMSRTSSDHRARANSLARARRLEQGT